MLSGWLIYQKQDARENESFITWFIDEAKRQNMSLKLVYPESLQFLIRDNVPAIHRIDYPDEKPDFAVVRTIDPLLSEHLEFCDIQVFNQSFISRIANDKRLTHLYMSRLNIPMPDTLFFNAETTSQLPPMTFPFVAKDPLSRGGRDVHLINNTDEWDRYKRDYQEQNILIQSCNVRLGRDLRVFVVGQNIVGAVLRENNDDFRANFKLGGTARLYQLNQEEEKLVQSIINAFDFGMVGLDFLIGHDGQLIFNEIEDIVGSRTLSATSSVNILSAYISHIHREKANIK